MNPAEDIFDVVNEHDEIIDRLETHRTLHIKWSPSGQSSQYSASYAVMDQFAPLPTLTGRSIAHLILTQRELNDALSQLTCLEQGPMWSKHKTTTTIKPLFRPNKGSIEGLRTQEARRDAIMARANAAVLIMALASLLDEAISFSPTVCM